MNRVKPIRFSEDTEFEKIEEIKEDDLDSQKEDLNLEKKEFELEKSRTFFYSGFAFISLLFITILISTLYDVVTKFEEILEFNSILGWIFIASASLIFILILKFIKNQLKSLKSLKSSREFQKRAIKLQETPSKDVVKFAKDIFREYQKRDELKPKIENLRDRLNSSILYDEVLELISEELIGELDKKSDRVISKYSQRATLATAVSPIAIVDILIIFWLNFKMVVEIAQIYGFKPTLFGNLVLFKQVLKNLIFAGGSELANDSISDIVGGSLLAKLSFGATQGVFNGVLTLRVGISAVDSVRVIPLKERETLFRKFFKVVSSSMKINLG